MKSQRGSGCIAFYGEWNLLQKIYQAVVPAFIWLDSG